MLYSKVNNPLRIKTSDLLYSFFPYLILTFCVFVDLLNGIIVMLFNMGFTIGVYYRGMLTIVLAIFTLKPKGTVRFYIFGLFILYLVSNIVWTVNEPYCNLLFDVKIFARQIYPFLIFNFFVVNKDRIDYRYLINLIITYGIVASIAIMFSLITGIGIPSYGEESFGIKSFFEGQNDISLVLLFSLLLSLYSYLHYHKFKYLLWAILITIGGILLGTRAGMVISLLLWLIMFYSLMFYRFRSSQIKLSKRIFSILIISLLITFASIIVINIVSKFDSMVKKFTIEAIIKGAEYSRSGLVQSADQIISNGNIMQVMFGHSYSALGYKNYVNLLEMFNGTYLVSEDGEKFKTIESDFIETIGAYGIILGTAIIIFPVWFLLLSIINFVREKSLLNFSMFIGISMFLCHAYYAGHAIGSIMVAAPVSIFYFCIYRENFFKKC